MAHDSSEVNFLPSDARFYAVSSISIAGNLYVQNLTLKIGTSSFTDPIHPTQQAS